MAKKLLIALLLFGLSGAGCAIAQDKVTVAKGFHAWVSIIRLIANPTEYDGQGVQVKGYFVYERQGMSDVGYIYIDENSYTYQLDKNALAVKIPKELFATADQLDGKYVLLEGTADRNYLGPGSACAGGIILSRLEELVTRGAPRPAPGNGN